MIIILILIIAIILIVFIFIKEDKQTKDYINFLNKLYEMEDDNNAQR